MSNLVIALEVDRVDLVDAGSNSEAYIRLYKRKESNESMSYEEILQKIKPEHREIILAELEKAKASNNMQEELDAALAEKQCKDAEITKLKETIATLEKKTNKNDDYETIMKNASPEMQEIFKKLDAERKAAELISKQLENEKLEAIAKSKAAELKALPIEQDKLVNIVKNISDEVYEVLKAANKLIIDGPVLKSAIGTSSVTKNTDAWAKIESKAMDLMTAENISKQQAVTKVIKAEPDLYKEYKKSLMEV